MRDAQFFILLNYNLTVRRQLGMTKNKVYEILGLKSSLLIASRNSFPVFNFVVILLMLHL